MNKRKFKFVYGPVPSRRLGRSLGVDPIPFKTCNYSCVYCQLGRTLNFTNTRQSFFPREEILKEILEAVELERGKIDFITFVGNGEPTLNKDIGWLIRETKERTKIKIAVITNGALLYKPEVREDLKPANVVLPSLDAGSEEVFKKINRPHKELKFEKVIQGLIEFRKVYKGQLWLEIMLVKGLNDNEDELLKIRGLLEKIKPDRIYINVPIRPPAENWVEIPDEEAILKAHAILGEAIAIVNYEEGEFEIDEFEKPEDAILMITRRHPMREEQIVDILKKFGAVRVKEKIAELVKTGKLKALRYRGKTFYLPSYSRFAKR